MCRWKFWKSLNIWLRYGQDCGLLFGTTLRFLLSEGTLKPSHHGCHLTPRQTKCQLFGSKYPVYRESSTVCCRYAACSCGGRSVGKRSYCLCLQLQSHAAEFVCRCYWKRSSRCFYVIFTSDRQSCTAGELRVVSLWYKAGKQSWVQFQLHHYSCHNLHCESKKNCATFIFTVTLANVGRFLPARRYASAG